MKKPLYIFVHVQKTAGSTLRRHIEKNFTEDERLLLAYEDLANNGKRTSLAAYRAKAKKQILAISPKKRDKIKVVYGHDVPYGVHTYFKNKTARYITFFRNPFTRTLSLYNFYLSRYLREPQEKKNTRVYKTQLLVNGSVPDFKTWLEEKYAKPRCTLKNTTQILTDLGFLPKDPSKTDIEQMLGRFYFVGITERSSSDLAYVYGLFEINKFFVDDNISIKYEKPESAKKYQKLVDAKNGKGLFIYAMAKKQNQKFRKQNKNYSKIVEQVHKRRSRLLLYTQLRYDLKGFLINASQFLRRNVPGYSKVIDVALRRDL